MSIMNPRSKILLLEFVDVTSTVSFIPCEDLNHGPPTLGLLAQSHSPHRFILIGQFNSILLSFICNKSSSVLYFICYTYHYMLNKILINPRKTLEIYRPYISQLAGNRPFTIFKSEK